MWIQGNKFQDRDSCGKERGSLALKVQNMITSSTMSPRDLSICCVFEVTVIMPALCLPSIGLLLGFTFSLSPLTHLRQISKRFPKSVDRISILFFKSSLAELASENFCFIRLLVNAYHVRLRLHDMLF